MEDLAKELEQVLASNERYAAKVATQISFHEGEVRRLKDVLKSLGFATRSTGQLTSEALEPKVRKILEEEGGSVSNERLKELLQTALKDEGVKKFTGIDAGLRPLATKWRTNDSWGLERKEKSRV